MMLYLPPSNKHDIFETFPLLELQMEELVPYFCKMAMVTNGVLFLHGLARQMTIRNIILTRSSFRSCKIGLRLAAPHFFFRGSKLTTPILVIRDSGRFWQRERFGLVQTKTWISQLCDVRLSLNLVETSGRYPRLA